MAGTGHGQRTGNLPAESTSFVGRRSELRGVESLLETSRLVTLTGVGGVGKSRLALRAADRMRRAFPHGVWVVPLAPLREPTLLGIAVLEELCLADRTTRSAEEVVAEWLADKELLLVLDSCEHLVGACARMAETFLAAAPGLRILATSRQPLGVAEERRFEVDPLPIVNPERDARPDTKAGHGPDVETGPWPNTKASPGPDTETGPRPNVETGPGPNVKTDPGPDVKTGPRP
ncbi:NB-ARC domain-containing protein, partial [Streptomyces sp. NPDC050704]|uniref:NB-ARC domain-containing protein n=1 Tax=Streptomyces sp. NPDC050704 TaxID=3157219 RepID=UPI00344959A0